MKNITRIFRILWASMPFSIGVLVSRFYSGLIPAGLQLYILNSKYLNTKYLNTKLINEYENINKTVDTTKKSNVIGLIFLANQESEFISASQRVVISFSRLL